MVDKFVKEPKPLMAEVLSEVREGRIIPISFYAIESWGPVSWRQRLLPLL